MVAAEAAEDAVVPALVAAATAALLALVALVDSFAAAPSSCWASAPIPLVEVARSLRPGVGGFVAGLPLTNRVHPPATCAAPDASSVAPLASLSACAGSWAVLLLRVAAPSATLVAPSASLPAPAAADVVPFASALAPTPTLRTPPARAAVPSTSWVIWLVPEVPSTSCWRPSTSFPASAATPEALPARSDEEVDRPPAVPAARLTAARAPVTASSTSST